MLNIQELIEKNSIKAFFQVIISPIDTLSFSVEGFVRGLNPMTGELIPPNILFKEAFNHDLVNDLDKVCIKQIFKSFKPLSILNPRVMLHINISNSFMNEATDSLFLSQCAKDLNIDQNRIVIDVNNLLLDEASIAKTTNFIEVHRNEGFYISIDDIGRDYSNIDKIMVFNPDIIKINHQMLNQLSHKSYQSNLIERITKIAHEMGILVISTGIETEDHLIDAVKSGAQLLQGFYLSPTAELNHEGINEIISEFDYDMVFELLNAEHRIIEKNVIVNVVTFNATLRNIIEEFHLSQLDDYAQRIMAKYFFIESGYVLDSKGIQVCQTYINKKSFGNRNQELFGLYNVGFNHSDEEIFYRLESPILTDWTIKPFRSRLTNELCVTGSFKVGPKDKPYIVVLNFDYIKFEAYLAKTKQTKHIPISI